MKNYLVLLLLTGSAGCLAMYSSKDGKQLSISELKLIAKQAEVCAKINSRREVVLVHEKDSWREGFWAVSSGSEAREKCRKFLEFFAQSLEIPEKEKPNK